MDTNKLKKIAVWYGWQIDDLTITGIGEVWYRKGPISIREREFSITELYPIVIKLKEILFTYMKLESETHIIRLKEYLFRGNFDLLVDEMFDSIEFLKEVNQYEKI